VSFPIVIRDRREDAEAAFAALLAHNGAPDAGNVPNLLGSPAEVAGSIAPYAEMGFSTVIARLPAPYDRETIERIGEVGDALRG
jgi:alkanesulfonate monooxygenase SsuD/methylene tetrahydromethanopterin reductase-like flavin-dependent oxidoreductase (luciferase family)